MKKERKGHFAITETGTGFVPSKKGKLGLLLRDIPFQTGSPEKHWARGAKVSFYLASW
jgi:hypothetical protein